MGWTFRKHQCMHCTDASCVNVCPVGAAEHYGEFVLIDEDWCVGCGYCVQACPFEAVHRLMPKGHSLKCNFCIDRVVNGLTPACAQACPTGAIQFGERQSLIEAAHRRVVTLIENGYTQARIYGETELGGLGQMYILTRPASFLGLPESPKVVTSALPSRWLSGFAAISLMSLVLWLSFRRKRQIEEKQLSNVGGAAR
ncbi:4Fe-4S dicluster domain-containing protein [Chloroflexota bacterium]